MSPRSFGCGDARDLLAERPDRALAPREEEALRAHLEDCPSCAAAAAGLERVDALLAGMNVEDPGVAFTDEVIRRLDRAPGSRSPGALPPAEPVRHRLLRAAAFSLGTAAVALAAALILPTLEGAVAVGGLLPDLPAPDLRGLAGSTGALLAGNGALLPPWAALAGAVAAGAALVLQVAGARRRPGA